jgi:uncharacterized protein YfaA (DUF2138 family)
VPNIWKTAFVCPFFKKGKKFDAINYRPVSLTCIACKITEQIITSSIMTHDTSDESSFKTLGIILSGPAALCGFKLWSSLATPFSVIWISGMVGKFPAILKSLMP